MNGQNQSHDVDKYIETFPKEVQLKLEELRKTIKEEIDNVEEFITYKMPTFKLNGETIIFFAAWKNHISIYPVTREMEKNIKGISEYKTSGKGTIQFPINKPLPLALVKEMIVFLLKKS